MAAVAAAALAVVDADDDKEDSHPIPKRSAGRPLAQPLLQPTADYALPPRDEPHQSVESLALSSIRENSHGLTFKRVSIDVRDALNKYTADGATSQAKQELNAMLTRAGEAAPPFPTGATITAQKRINRDIPRVMEALADRFDALHKLYPKPGGGSLGDPDPAVLLDRETVQLALTPVL